MKFIFKWTLNITLQSKVMKINIHFLDLLSSSIPGCIHALYKQSHPSPSVSIIIQRESTFPTNAHLYELDSFNQIKRNHGI